MNWVYFLRQALGEAEKWLAEVANRGKEEEERGSTPLAVKASAFDQ